VLVEEKSLALWTDASYERVSIDPGLFTVSLRVAPGKRWTEAQAVLFETLEAVKQRPLAQRELERAKNLVEASFTFAQDSLFYRGFLVGEHAVVGDWKLVTKVVPGIRAVGAEEVRAAARKYLTEDNRTVGVLIPTSAKKEAK
jgi:zinc protease